MSNINITSAAKDSKKYLDDIYRNYPNKQNTDLNSSYISSVSIYSNNGESNVFSYGYSNINNTEKEMYYGGKFNKNGSKEELGKSLNKSDFKVKRITNKNKQDESSYEFIKPYFMNETKTIQNNSESKKYHLSNSKLKTTDIIYGNNFIKNIFNDPFFANF